MMWSYECCSRVQADIAEGTTTVLVHRGGHICQVFPTRCSAYGSPPICPFAVPLLLVFFLNMFRFACSSSDSSFLLSPPYRPSSLLLVLSVKR